MSLLLAADYDYSALRQQVVSELTAREVDHVDLNAVLRLHHAEYEELFAIIRRELEIDPLARCVFLSPNASMLGRLASNDFGLESRTILVGQKNFRPYRFSQLLCVAIDSENSHFEESTNLAVLRLVTEFASSGQLTNFRAARRIGS